MKTISEFKGQYEFLSNFYPSKIMFHNRLYPTVEHAFQASKTDDYNEQEAIRLVPDARAAKKYGRKVTLRANWDGIRVAFMKAIVLEKFKQNPDLLEKLLDTGDAVLEEGNYWQDKFWGVFNGQGDNNLGKVLMEVREELKPQKATVISASYGPLVVNKRIETKLYSLYYDGKYTRTYRTKNFINGAITQRVKYGRKDRNKFEIVEYVKQ